VGVEGVSEEETGASEDVGNVGFEEDEGSSEEDTDDIVWQSEFEYSHPGIIKQEAGTTNDL